MNYDYSKRGYLLPKGCKDLVDVLKHGTGGKAPLNPRTDEEIRDVFRRYCPTIADGTVEIVSLARKGGRHCLVLVRSREPNISAVAACSLERGERLNAFHAEVGCERLSVMLWNPSSEELIKRAFPIETVILDSNTRQAAVTPHPYSRNLARGNSRSARMISEMADLISAVTGWKITVAAGGDA